MPVTPATPVTASRRRCVLSAYRLVVEAAPVDTTRRSLTLGDLSSSHSPTRSDVMSPAHTDQPLPAAAVRIAAASTAAAGTAAAEPDSPERTGGLRDLSVPSISSLGSSTLGELGGAPAAARPSAPREVSFSTFSPDDVAAAARNRRITSAEAWRECFGYEGAEAMERSAQTSLAGLSIHSRGFSTTRTRVHTAI